MWSLRNQQTISFNWSIIKVPPLWRRNEKWAIQLLTGIPPWNKDKLVGQKLPLKLKDIWAIRIRLQIAKNLRDLAMFNLALDSKLRARNLVRLKLTDISHESLILHRTTIMQKKTGQPVQFEISEQTRESLINWIQEAGLNIDDYLFPSRIHTSPHITTRQY